MKFCCGFFFTCHIYLFIYLIFASRPVTGQFLGLQDPLGLILESCVLSHLVIKTFHEDFLKL